MNNRGPQRKVRGCQPYGRCNASTLRPIASIDTGRNVQPHEGGGEGTSLDSTPAAVSRPGGTGGTMGAAPADQEERGEVVDDLVVAVASHGNRGTRHSCAKGDYFFKRRKKS